MVPPSWPIPPAAGGQQQALYGEYVQEQGRRKIAKTQDQCRKKLQEVGAGGW